MEFLFVFLFIGAATVGLYFLFVLTVALLEWFHDAIEPKENYWIKKERSDEE